jgi:hypothetical protein
MLAKQNRKMAGPGSAKRCHRDLCLSLFANALPSALTVKRLIFWRPPFCQRRRRAQLQIQNPD